MSDSPLASLPRRLLGLLQGKGWLSHKMQEELDFWRRTRREILAWYDGTPMPESSVPPPSEAQKIRGHDPIVNAILTWLQFKAPRYPERLQATPDHFSGKRLLDVGCGPIPVVTGFTGCELYGIDSLTHRYREIGFPLDFFADRITYLKGAAERIPVADDFFDVVISVNAIDHVDDFFAAAREIDRVLRPEGVLRFEAHYHPPHICEPWSFTDAMILEAFQGRALRKVHTRELNGKDERFVVWTSEEA